ncbi:hypothetical protein C8F01DRAFT_555994 [Mycena amicta]|nr:hypothetical protein C8F01DRAFT_555994 [Mycena amicta]
MGNSSSSLNPSSSSSSSYPTSFSPSSSSRSPPMAGLLQPSRTSSLSSPSSPGRGSRSPKVPWDPACLPSFDREPGQLHTISLFLTNAFAGSKSKLSWNLGVRATRPTSSGEKPEFPGYCHWGIVIQGMKYELGPDAHEDVQCRVDLFDAEKEEQIWVVEIGQTDYTSAGVIKACKHVQSTMESAYDPLTNNCQHFVLRLLSIITVGDLEWPEGIREAIGETRRIAGVLLEKISRGRRQNR